MTENYKAKATKIEFTLFLLTYLIHVEYDNS